MEKKSQPWKDRPFPIQRCPVVERCPVLRDDNWESLELEPGARSLFSSVILEAA